jgi:hypothetical protein
MIDLVHGLCVSCSSLSTPCPMVSLHGAPPFRRSHLIWSVLETVDGRTVAELAVV